MSGAQAIAVDWSGDRRAARRRIALARAVPGRLLEVRTGLDRGEAVALALDRAAAAGRAVVGLDFSFGLPAWFARSHDVHGIEALWELVAREGEGWLTTCAPPFWGRPGTRRPADVPGREQYRRTEYAARSAGLAVGSTFQVGGAGAVGTGSLRGMPWLARIRAAGVAVWPFDDAARVTVLEVYPRAFTGPVVKRSVSARRAVVGADPRIPEDLRAPATATEDAFDAALSAVGLAEHLAELADLPAAPAASDAALEGELWRPLRSAPG